MRLILALSLIFLTACSGNSVRSPLDRVEFDDDEAGCAEIEGTMNVGGYFGVGSTQASFKVLKYKDTVTDETGTRQVQLPGCEQ